MRINQRKESVAQRRSLQEHQLCRLLTSLPQRQPLPRSDSEFDDQGISRAPLTKLAEHKQLLQHKGDFLDDSGRRERIKMKIKSKLREGFNQKVEREFQRRSSEFYRSKERHSPQEPAKSEFFLIRKPARQEQLQQILANCVIQPVSLQEKVLPRRTAATRSRIINSVLEMRTKANSCMHHRPVPQNKRSTPRLLNPEITVDRLEPWRYADQDGVEGLFRKENQFRLH